MNIVMKRVILSPFNLLYRLNPEIEQRILFRIKCHEKLNLKNPITYNEKLNWLKLYDRNPLIPLCADKYTARKYIEDCGFGDYLPRLIWHGTDPDELRFNTLPDKCIIKITSGSGRNIIFDKLQRTNIDAVKKQLKLWLKEKYLPAYGEWHYGLVDPSIIVEEFISDNVHKVPFDYKLFCFNGLNHEVGFLVVDSGRFVDHCRNVYDKDFTFLQDVTFGFKINKEDVVSKPDCYDEMCRVASSLSKEFYHCRIDFYVVQNRFYIGEITFYNGAGYDMLKPLSFSKKVGSWIHLPMQKIS